jgi:16S rRNA processing protein RimM
MTDGPSERGDRPTGPPVPPVVPGGRVQVGRLGKTHGLEGEMYLDSLSLSALELHEVKRLTWRRPGVPERVLTLATAHPALARILVRFEGIGTRERAAELTNGELWVDVAALPDPGPTTVYTFQLIGLRVETPEGRVLGTIANVITTAAQPIYVVKGEREILVPGVLEVVRRVDLAAGLVVVELPAGLEEL